MLPLLLGVTALIHPPSSYLTSLGHIIFKNMEHSIYKCKLQQLTALQIRMLSCPDIAARSFLCDIAVESESENLVPFIVNVILKLVARRLSERQHIQDPAM